MSIIDKNQPNWFSNAGEPLKSGYIYIGQPNQTPVENPKTVTFTDSSGNAFTATQPLRTNSDGQIVWNGKAITATVLGDYSMLILDSTQTQINGGHVPLVEGDDSTVITLADYREYGLLLADIKKLDVSPGQTVGNIGKVLVLDGFGANWLVVSPTGSPPDDVDLIDFDNGLQGQRVVHSSYQKAVAGHIRAGNTQLWDGRALPASILDVDSDVTVNTWESVGMTASGADNIWTALDIIPSNATVAIVDVEFRTTTSGTGSGTVTLWSSDGDDPSPSTSDANKIAVSILDINEAAGAVGYTGRIALPLGETNQDFNLQYSSTSTGTITITMKYRGFMTD